MATRTTVSPTARDTTAEIAYLTRALKAPTLRDAVTRLGDRARTEGWTHEQFLAACLQREVAARESHGGEGRIRAARFPARKSLEEFDFDHQRSLKRDLIAHLGCCPALKMSTRAALTVRMWGCEKTPLAGCRAGSWCSGCRFGAQSAVTSVTAVRVEDSSTMDLSAAKAATRDWMARLLTARG